MASRSPSASFGGVPAPAKANWFADLALTRHGLIVRKTGRRIGLAEITPMELAKFLLYLGYVLAGSAWVRLRHPRGPTVYFAPDRPRPWYIIWSAMALGGMRIARTPEDADASVYFEDVTIGKLPAGLPASAFNAQCTDISKSRVAILWAEIAGYPLSIDPGKHRGKAVEKSECNGTHDGRIVTCPCSPMTGRVYQTFVDASDGVTAIDLRTTIIGRRPLFVVVKTKPAAKRFSIHNDRVALIELDEVFSGEEIDLLTRFAERMQLDWAAIDVLRDRTSGKIYVVDVNKTDTGPAVDLSWRDRVKFTTVITRAFADMVSGRRAPL